LGPVRVSKRAWLRILFILLGALLWWAGHRYIDAQFGVRQRRTELRLPEVEAGV